VRAALPLAAAALLAGCGPGPGFAQLGDFQLLLQGASSGLAQASFDYDFQSLGCKTLDGDFTAAVNGSPTDVFRGASQTHLLFGTTCVFPSFVFTRPPQLNDGVLMVASSGRDHLAVQVDGVGLSLGGVPLVAPGEVIHVGQRIQLQLASGWERVSWPASCNVSLEGQGGPTLVGIAPPSAQGVLDVQLPSTLPPGQQHVLVNLVVTPTFSQCEGPARGCGVDELAVLQAKLDVSFQVQP